MLQLKRIIQISLITAFIVMLSFFINGCEKKSSSNNDDTKIYFGIILPQTGSLSNLGPSWLDGVKLAVDHINEDGGILGKTLKIINIDSQTDPEIAVSAALDLIENNNVHIIIGAGASDVTIALAESLKAKDVIIMSPTSTSPRITTLEDNNRLWRTAPSDIFQGNYMASKAIDLSFMRASIFYQDDSYGKGVSDGFISTYESRGGELLKSISFEAGLSTYISQLRELFADSIDVVILPTYINCARIILDQWHGLDLGGNWIISEANFQQSILTSMDSVEGIYVVEIAPAEDTDFKTIFKNKYGIDPMTFSANCYDAVMVLALAIERAGTLAINSIIESLPEVACPWGTTIGIGKDEYTRGVNILETGGDINYEGASGKIDFDGNGDVTDVNFKLWLIQDGEFVEVN
jgi:ABC-type branched-subunit amino acid transport system substrate-binding protein